MIVMPSQYALKLPATRPDRMFSDGPPSRDDVTTSFTCRDSVEVNTFTNSGMSAPASVPQEMIVASFHHCELSPPRLGIISDETTYVNAIETSEVIQTSEVSGVSKFISLALPNLAFAIAALMKYAAALAINITTRITKIHTSS